MKSKIILSSLVLFFFSILAGGSEDQIKGFGIIFVAACVIAIIVGLIGAFVEGKNKEKRLQMIKDDEQSSPDFDRSVSIGDDRCKIYFDSSKKQVMIMRVMTEGIKKIYIDDFEFPGKELAIYTSPVFNIYDPIKRRWLTGTYDDEKIKHQIISIEEKDKYKDIVVNNSIQPRFRTLRTKQTVSGYDTTHLYNILIDECHGLMASTELGCLKSVFNYINADSLPRKRGDKSTINTRTIGNYLFIMDDFYKVLVFFGPDTHELFNYADILEVSYEENGDQLYTKSAGRTVGGAIVGGVLMGGAGAVVGGLSGASKQNKEIKNMDIKILLRSTSRTSCVLKFKDIDRTLKTKDESDKKLYETYINNANQAKDLFSIIIDKAKQVTVSTVQPTTQHIPSSSPSIADELAKLAKLKAEGILTEEEFSAQKAKLLNQ